MNWSNIPPGGNPSESETHIIGPSIIEETVTCNYCEITQKNEVVIWEKQKEAVFTCYICGRINKRTEE